MNETFAERIKMLRIRSGLTQQQVAESIGTTKSTISKYEHGLRKVNNEHLCKMAEIYEVDPLYLFLGKTEKEFQDGLEKEVQQLEKEEKEYWSDILLDDSLKKMKELLEMLNDEGVRTAIERVEELTEIPRYQYKDGE